MTVLIVAKEGPFRESLVALLRALPEIGSIACLDDPEDAFTHDGGVYPTVVLLDGDLITDETHAVVTRASLRWPEAGLILFANDVGQQRAAETAGVAAALLKGHPAPHVISIIRAMVIGRRQRVL